MTAGLVVADPPSISASCAASSVTAAPGTDSISLSGASDESCTFTVDLTASKFVKTGDAPQTFKNCASNFTAVDGARLDTRCGVLTFRAKPVLSVSTATVEFDGHGTGEVLHFISTIENRGDLDFTDEHPAQLSANMTDALDDSTYNDDAVMTIDGAAVGTVTRDGDTLNWAGALEAGATGELTFSVSVLETSPTSAGNRNIIVDSCVPLSQSFGEYDRCWDRGINNNLVPFLDTSWISGNNGVNAVQPTPLVEGSAIDFYWTFKNDSAGLLTDLAPNISKINDVDTTTATSGITIDCPAVVAPGGRGVCHGQLIATADDAANGYVSIVSVLEGNVEGEFVDGNTRTTYSDIQLPAKFRVYGDAPPLKDVKVNDTIQFVYRIENQGGEPLTDFVLAQRGGGTIGEIEPLVCDDNLDPLVPGNVAYCTADYTITEEDVVYGNVLSSLSVTAVGTLTDTALDTVSGQNRIGISNEPELRISTPTALNTEGLLPGGEMQFQFKVRNTGAIVVTDTSLESTNFSGENALTNVSCEATTLSANEATTCTADYSVTQNDLDGSLLLASTKAVAMADVTEIGPSFAALGFTDGGKTDDWRERDPSYAVPTQVSSNIADGAVFLNPAKELESESAADATEIESAGTPVEFTFSFTNSGNTTLDDVELVPAGFVGEGELSEFACPADVTLSPGDAMNCTASYTTTDADMASEFIENSAFARGIAREGDVVLSPMATSRVALSGDIDPSTPTNPAKPAAEGSLPWTGSTPPIAGGIAAVVLLALGTAFAVSSRKRAALRNAEVISE